MTDLVGHLLIFGVVVTVGLALPLVVGRFMRPKLPTDEKVSIYECGEPAIGSSYVQFDLRFYVVALLFIIFDVEVAFFFPWAMIFGGATQLADPRLSDEARTGISQKLLSLPDGALASADAISAETGLNLALTGLVDILVFFGVLLVGFAYVWKRGDLDWVRAVTSHANRSSLAPTPPTKHSTETQREPQPVG